MFTGIISHTGTLARKDGARYFVRADKKIIGRLEPGTSISINGACCTVLKKNRDRFSIEIMPETEKRTAFGKLEKNARVNLELPATPRTFLSGHIVQGHVDGIGVVKAIRDKGNSRLLTVKVPKQLSKYIVEKGSIAVHGVSLTVVRVRASLSGHGEFTVGVIPFTSAHTTLGSLRVGDAVNIEVDVLAKYIERLTKRV